MTGDGDMIILAQQDSQECPLVKLALSNGLADSVKIATLENYIDEHIERVKEIPPILESGRQIPIRYSVLSLIDFRYYFIYLLKPRRSYQTKRPVAAF